MKNIVVMTASVLALAACSSNETAKLLIEDPVKYNTQKVETQLAEVPDWYLNPPREEEVIYTPGTAVSPDMQLSVDIAILNAKTVLADRINSSLSSKTKNFISRIGSSDLDAAVSQDMERATTNLIADVDVAGYYVDKTRLIQDGPQYRAYVLLSYSDAEANKILVNRIRKDRVLLEKIRATSAYKDLEESVDKKRNQNLNEMEIIVKGLGD